MYKPNQRIFSKSACYLDFHFFFSKIDKKYYILDCKLKKIGCKMQWKPRWTRIDFCVFEDSQSIVLSFNWDAISNWYFEVALWLAGALGLDIWLAESAI